MIGEQVSNGRCKGSLLTKASYSKLIWGPCLEPALSTLQGDGGPNCGGVFGIDRDGKYSNDGMDDGDVHYIYDFVHPKAVKIYYATSKFLLI